MPDWSLYLVTDSRLLGGRSLPEVVAAAIRGGVTVVQYREKQATTRAMVEAARALREVTRSHGVPLLINDRLDVALACGADGVHLGQDDMPLPEARRILGTSALIGVTVHHAAELERAEAEGADYLSVAPVFATSTKPDHQTPLGLTGLRALAVRAHLPAVAIAGIQLENAGEVIRAGVQGVCVVSAIIAAADPQGAARTLLERIETGGGHAHR